MISQKKCKGTGKAKGYGCNTLVDVVKFQKSNRIYGLGISCGCYSKWLKESPEGQQKVIKHTLKATKDRRELEQAEKQRKTRKSLGALKEQTQIIFNRYIRLRDKFKPCISENIAWKEDFQAGHCFPVGKFDGLRFDFDNVHGQSVQGNIHKQGNQSEYLINLSNRIGQERRDALIKKAGAYKKNGYKFTREELLQIQKDCKNKIKDLENDVYRDY